MSKDEACEYSNIITLQHYMASSQILSVLFGWFVDSLELIWEFELYSIYSDVPMLALLPRQKKKRKRREETKIHNRK